MKQKDTSEERELLVLEVMMLAYAVHQRTDYCVFIDFSGHVDSISISIRESINNWEKKVCETEVYNLYREKYYGNADEQDGYLKSVRDVLKEILKKGDIPYDKMQKHIEQVYHYSF